MAMTPAAKPRRNRRRIAAAVVAVLAVGLGLAVWMGKAEPQLRQRGGAGHVFRDRVALENLLGFSPDGKTLATGHADDSVVLWDVSGGTATVRTRLEVKAITPGRQEERVPLAITLRFAPDSATVATTDPLLGVVKIWAAAEGRRLATFRGEDPLFTRDGATLVVRNGNRLVLHDTRTWEPRAEVELPGGEFTVVLGLAARDDGQVAVVRKSGPGTFDLALLDPKDGGLTPGAQVRPERRPGNASEKDDSREGDGPTDNPFGDGATDDPFREELAEDGRSLLVWHTDALVVHKYRVPDGAETWSRAAAEGQGRVDPVEHLWDPTGQSSPDGRTVVTPKIGGTDVSWDTVGGGHVEASSPSPWKADGVFRFNDVAFDAGGRVLVRRLDANVLRNAWVMKQPAWVSQYALRLVDVKTVHAARLEARDTRTGALIGAAEKESEDFGDTRRIYLSPDGRTLAAPEHGGFVLFDVPAR